MAVGYLHYKDMKKFLKILLLSNGCLDFEKNGYGPLKNSGERTRAILALLLSSISGLKDFVSSQAVSPFPSMFSEGYTPGL